MRTTITVRRLLNSAPQIKLLLSLGEVVEMVPEVSIMGIRKSTPLCLTAEDGSVFRFEGYPTGSLSNQDKEIETALVALLGNQEEVEFEIEGKLSLGKPASRSTGRSVVQVVWK